jgi:hypothetical protein
MNPKGYLSLFIAFALTVLPAFGVAATSNFSQKATVTLMVAIFGTFAVYMAPNLPNQDYVKPAMAAALALVQSLDQVIGVGGFAALTFPQYVVIATAVGAAVGVTAFPNQPKPPASVPARVAGWIPWPR